MSSGKKEPKISFGIIVLNGEPYTRYLIRTLYPHAYEIIVVEGACPGAKFVAAEDGHSSDGTLNTLKEMQENEDPDNKLVIVTAEDEGYADGFWPGEKTEQSRAYAKRAVGDYLWQVDSDEFYKHEDIIRVKRILAENPSITAISFIQKQFWGGFDYLVYGWYLQRGGREFFRLFRWGEGFEYKTHRPPTVLDADGKDTRSGNFLRGKKLSKMGIYLYHYSFLFPKQVFEKANYYQNAIWSPFEKADWWANNVYMKLEHPFRVFTHYWDISWLKRFKGEHPEQIMEMRKDIENGRLSIDLRRTDDIEALLKNRFYRLKIFMLRTYNLLYFKSVRGKKFISGIIKKQA